MRIRFSRFRQGFTAIEAVTAVVVAGVAVGVTTHYLSSATKARSEMQIASERQTFASFQQDVALRGVDPTQVMPIGAVVNSEYLRNAPNAGDGVVVQAGEKHNSALVASSGQSQTRAVNTMINNMENRSMAFGLQLAADGSEVSVSTQGLGAPTWPGDLVSLTAADFPYTAEINPNPINPPGTIYRFTTDGSDPTESSPIWFSTVFNSAAEVPQVLKARAFNADPLYEPSPVATVSPSVGLGVELERELVTATPDLFSYADLTGLHPVTGAAVPRNYIVLEETSGADPSAYQIRYTTDGTDPTPASLLYSGAFKISENDSRWASGIPLRIAAFATKAGLRNSEVAPFILTALKVNLSAPEVTAPGGTLSAGDSISLVLGSVNAALETRVTYGSVELPEVITTNVITVKPVGPDGQLIN